MIICRDGIEVSETIVFRLSVTQDLGVRGMNIRSGSRSVIHLQ